MTQSEQKAPKVDASDVAMMIRALEGSGWLKARDLSAIGDERYLRAVANASEGKILSGNSGYKLTTEATFEERAHATKRLRRQAAEMIKRAFQIETTAAMSQGV